MTIPRFAHFYNYIDSDWYNYKHFLKYEYLQLIFAGILSVPYLLLSRGYQLYSYLMLMYLIFLGFEFAHIYLFYSYPNTSTYFTIFDTNYRESMEFFNDYLGINIVLLISLYFIILVVANYVVKKLLLGYLINHAKPAFIYGNLALLAILPLVHISGKLYPLDLDSLSLFEASESLIEYFEDKEKLKEIGEREVVFDPFEVQFNTSIPHTHIIVIGESTSKHHMSLYGYQRLTNPLLKNEDLLIFKDAIAPNAHTIYSLEKAFTFKNSTSPDLDLEQGSLVDIANQAGYKTYWLSNQGFAGENETPISILAQRSDVKKYTNPMGQAIIYDDALVPFLENALSDNDQNKVIFIHLMGTHITYKERYPISYNHFTNKFFPEDLLWDAYGQEIINHYDNAVLFNDYVVYSLLEQAKNLSTPCTFTYFSDHGDEVFDIKYFHGHADVTPSKYMYEIPMIFWANNSFIEENIDKIELLKEHLDQPFKTENLIHFFIDVINAYPARFEKSLSPFNEEYK